MLHLESAFGVSYFNAFNDSISYLDANKAARIYQRLNLGMSFSVNMENQYYNTGRGISACVDNLYSARLLAGITEEFANDPMLLGLGGELGIFDTAFLRMGYHHDEAGNINGITYGIGINAHYRDLVSAVYNYSFFPGGSFNADKKVSNYSFSVNILGIFKELNHEQ